MKERTVSSVNPPATVDALSKEEAMKQFSSSIKLTPLTETKPNKQRFDAFCQNLKAASLSSSSELSTLFSQACALHADTDAVLALLNQLPRLPNKMLEEALTLLLLKEIMRVYFIASQHCLFLIQEWTRAGADFPGVPVDFLGHKLLDIFHNQLIKTLWSSTNPKILASSLHKSTQPSYYFYELIKKEILFFASQTKAWSIEALHTLALHSEHCSPLSLFFFTEIYPKRSEPVEQDKATQLIERLKQEAKIENLLSATIKSGAAYELVALLYWAVSCPLDQETLAQFNTVISYLEGILTPAALSDLHDEQPCAAIILSHQSRRLASNIDIKNIAFWLKHTCSSELLTLVPDQDLGALFWALCETDQHRPLPMTQLDLPHNEGRPSIQAECTLLQAVFETIARKAEHIKDLKQCKIGDKGHIFLRMSLLKILSADDSACLQALHACSSELASQEVVNLLFSDNLEQPHIDPMMRRLFINYYDNRWNKKLLDVALSVFNAPKCAFWLCSNIVEDNYNWLSAPGCLFQLLLQKEALAEIIIFVQKCTNSFVATLDEVMHIIRLGIQSNASVNQWPESIFKLALPYQNTHFNSATEIIQHLKIEEGAEGASSLSFCENFCAKLKENSAHFVASLTEATASKSKKNPQRKQVQSFINDIQTGLINRKAQEVFDGIKALVKLEISSFSKEEKLSLNEPAVYQKIFGQIIDEKTSITSQALCNLIIEDPHLALITLLPLFVLTPLLTKTYSSKKLCRKLFFLEILITSLEMFTLQGEWEKVESYISIINSVFVFFHSASPEFSHLTFCYDARLLIIFFTLLKNIQVAVAKNNPTIEALLKKLIPEIFSGILSVNPLDLLWTAAPLSVLEFIHGYQADDYITRAIQQHEGILFQQILHKAAFDLEALRHVELSDDVRHRIKYYSAIMQAVQVYQKSSRALPLVDGNDNGYYINISIAGGAALDNLPFVECALVLQDDCLSDLQQTRVLKAMEDKLPALVTPASLPPTLHCLILLSLERCEKLWHMVLTQMEQKEDFSLGDYEIYFKEACRQKIAEELRKEIITKLKSLNFNAETTSLTWAASAGHSPLASLSLTEIDQQDILLRNPPLDIQENNCSQLALLEILAVARLAIKPDNSQPAAWQKLDIRCALVFARKGLNYLKEAISTINWKLVFCLARNLKDFRKKINCLSEDFILLFQATIVYALEDKTLMPLLNILVQEMLERKLPIDQSIISGLKNHTILTLCGHACNAAEQEPEKDFTATYLFFMNQWRNPTWPGPIYTSATLLQTSFDLKMDRASHLLRSLFVQPPAVPAEISLLEEQAADFSTQPSFPADSVIEKCTAAVDQLDVDVSKSEKDFAPEETQQSAAQEQTENTSETIESVNVASSEEPQPPAVPAEISLLEEQAADLPKQSSFSKELIIVPVAPPMAPLLDLLSRLWQQNCFHAAPSIAAQHTLATSPLMFRYNSIDAEPAPLRLHSFFNLLSFLPPIHYLPLLNQSIYYGDVDAVLSLILWFVTPKWYNTLQDFLQQMPLPSLLMINAIIYKNQSQLPRNQSEKYALQIDKLLFHLRSLILNELSATPDKIFQKYFFDQQEESNHIAQLLYDPVVTSYLMDRLTYVRLWLETAIEKMPWCTGPRSLMSLFIFSTHSADGEPFKELVRKRFAAECSVLQLQTMTIHLDAAYELLTLLDWLSTADHDDFLEQKTYLRSKIEHCPMREMHKEAVYSATILRNPAGIEELDEAWCAWLLLITRSPELLTMLVAQPNINKFLIFWHITIFFVRSLVGYDSNMSIEMPINFRHFLISKINILLAALFHHINNAIEEKIIPKEDYIALAFLQSDAERKDYLQFLLSAIIRSDSVECLAEFISFLRKVESEDVLQALLLDPMSSDRHFKVSFFRENQNALDMALQSSCAPRCALLLNQLWDNAQYSKIHHPAFLLALLVQKEDVAGLQKFLTHCTLNFYINFEYIMQLIPLLLFKTEPVCLDEVVTLAIPYRPIYFRLQERREVIQSFKDSLRAKKGSLTEADIERGALLFFQALDSAQPTLEIRLAAPTFETREEVEKSYQQARAGHLMLLCKNPDATDFENHLSHPLKLMLMTHLIFPKIGRPMPFLEALLTLWEPLIIAKPAINLSKNYFLLIAKVFCVFHENAQLIRYEPFLLFVFLHYTKAFHQAHAGDLHINSQVKNILPKVLNQHTSEEALAFLSLDILRYLCIQLTGYDSIYPHIYYRCMHVFGGTAGGREERQNSEGQIEETRESNASLEPNAHSLMRSLGPA